LVPVDKVAALKRQQVEQGGQIAAIVDLKLKASFNQTYILRKQLFYKNKKAYDFE
jgi:hypothetical protein